jgi:ubiquinone/menaquinone biosynthesis C-methylase UbiE
LIVSYLKAALDLKNLKALKSQGAPRPETIENRWDVLYRDYPEVYEEFASVPSSKSWLDVARQITGFKGKAVADIGSGTGKSTFLLARYAKEAIGIEPEEAMRKIAVEKAAELRVPNVSFKEGRAERIPLGQDAVDITVAVTAAGFYNRENIKAFDGEAGRVTRKGGHVLVSEFAPGWYGGELAHVILGTGRKPWTETWKDRVFEELGFKRRDFYVTRDYGTVEKAVRTYGFIFGKKAIDYVRAHKKTTIKWRARIYYKQV